MSVIFAKHKDIKNYPASRKYINRLESARKDEDLKKAKMEGWSRSKSLVMVDSNAVHVRIKF